MAADGLPKPSASTVLLPAMSGSRVTQCSHRELAVLEILVLAAGSAAKGRAVILAISIATVLLTTAVDVGIAKASTNVRIDDDDDDIIGFVVLALLQVLGILLVAVAHLAWQVGSLFGFTGHVAVEAPPAASAEDEMDIDDGAVAPTTTVEPNVDRARNLSARKRPRAWDSTRQVEQLHLMEVSFSEIAKILKRRA
ncbi:unnamed protein product [Prorocentrum cordatum]|uniref:Transmembrane protein 138 n=1 Tax=Prorocentrum cordatum TaxID=2364126 RepID=A0ABN9QVD8_9DINO|nr:unnamed protein product [Polarella glacialis]